MEGKLELVLIPVSEVDRAKAFYAEKTGFDEEHDIRATDEMPVVQLTPPRTACSIAFGTGMVGALPGSIQGLHLIVSDIDVARAELADRGVGVGDLVNTLVVAFLVGVLGLVEALHHTCAADLELTGVTA